MTDHDFNPRLAPNSRIRIIEAAFMEGDVTFPAEGVFLGYDVNQTFQGTPHPYRVKVDGVDEFYAAQVEPLEGPQRPRIDFAVSRYDTAREYAKAANSRVLTEANQAILKQVEEGYTVDAYALNAALTEAMSSCATRAGQSMARRELTKKVRHLGHIVQAVIENHADGLPAYDSAASRSRLVETLKGANLELREEREQAKVRQADAENAALRAINALDEQTAEFNRRRELFDAEVSRLIAAEREARTIIAGLTEDLTRHVALREYVEAELLDQGQVDQCVGFTHGYVSGQRS